MAPKKKGSKSSKGSSGGIIDGVPMTEMTREALETFTLRIRDELEREREERNFFQIERDKLKTFWEITRQQLLENNAEIRNKDRALEEAQHHHQFEIKSFKEKVKHLVFEHQSRVIDLKAENLIVLKLAEEQYNEQEHLLLEDKLALKRQIRESETSFEDFRKELYLEHSEKMYEMREDFKTQLDVISKKLENRMNKMRDYFDLKNKIELSEVEERRTSEIDGLIKAHNKSYTELKKYYKNVTDDNLALIATLKEELLELKGKNETANKMVAKLRSENAKLSKPLEEATNKIQELETKMKALKKDKESVLQLHKTLSVRGKELEELRTENSVLEANYEKLQKENEELKQYYISLISELEQNTAIQKIALHNKIDNLQDDLDSRDLQLANLITKANLNPKDVVESNIKLQKVKQAHLRRVKALQTELARAVHAHDSLLEFFTNKVKEFNVPIEGIEFTPLKPHLRDALTKSDVQQSSFDS